MEKSIIGVKSDIADEFNALQSLIHVETRIKPTHSQLLKYLMEVNKQLPIYREVLEQVTERITDEV